MMIPDTPFTPAPLSPIPRNICLAGRAFRDAPRGATGFSSVNGPDGRGKNGRRKAVRRDNR
jgi:hypothetical protein